MGQEWDSDGEREDKQKNGDCNNQAWHARSQMPKWPNRSCRRPRISSIYTTWMGDINFKV